MIEMAPETAMGCKEKRAGRWGSPFGKLRGQAVRRGRSKPFRRPQDVGHPPGCLVAKGLKISMFPAPSLPASERMTLHHFDQINRS
ncbi:hypothetical protein L598_000800001190 [Mesorhizobium sp. J18]|nr:hypothetical protein L598_000800001190 [Mesorhizobium sp. J18]